MGRLPKILMYHGVVPESSSLNLAEYGAHPAHAFRKQMKALKRIFRFITADEFASTVDHKKKFAWNSCMLTIDDGYRNLMTHIIPALEEWSIPALVFVNDSHIREKRWLWFNRFHAMRLRGKTTLAQLKQFEKLSIQDTNALLNNWHAPDATNAADEMEHHLFDGLNEQELQQFCRHPLITIGGHTSEHVRMTNETMQSLREDVLKNKNYLEQFTGYPLVHFAYPEGFTDERSASVIAECGYRYGYLAAPVKQHEMSLLHIPRIGIYQNGLGYLAAKLFTS